MIKTCECCGRPFTPAHNNNQKFCSVQCRRQQENRTAKQKYFAAKNRRGEKTLEEKVKEADAMGVSYGRYILLTEVLQS